HCVLALRALPSFPTRRSSDLYKSHLWFSLRIAGEDWAAHPVLWFEIFPAGYAYGMGIYDAKPATMARFRQDMDQHPQKMGKLARDRKSTRLNSSHVSISYAVF